MKHEEIKLCNNECVISNEDLKIFLLVFLREKQLDLFSVPLKTFSIMMMMMIKIE